MRFFEKLLSASITLLALILIGATVLQYNTSGGTVTQSILHVASETGVVISSVASGLSSQIVKAIEQQSGDSTQDSSGTQSASDTKTSSGAQSAGARPAIPVDTKITVAPAGSEAQTKVTAPVAAASLQSVWGKTGMQGITVYEYGKTLLNDTEKNGYIKIETAVQNVETQVTINTTLSPAQIKKIYEYYLYDHTEVFYMDGVSLGYYHLGANYTYQINFNYKYNGDKTKIVAMRSQLGKKALEVLGVANGLSTDLEKEKALHDKLIKLCTYNIEAAQNPKSNPESYSAYGALVNSNPVCQGYAQAMKLLLSSAGIKSLYITGQANGGSHSWNIVQIGGKWRYLDATFDDPVFSDGSGNYTSYSTVSYTYFNYKSNSDHTLGIFDSTNPFSETSENYAAMPKVN